jgi:hypothetical protein
MSPRSLLPFGNIRPGESIEVLKGECWITQENDPKDYIVKAGERFTADRKGHLLAEALTEARVRWERSPSLRSIAESKRRSPF